MTATNGTPEPSRILSLDGSKPTSKARDDQGRVLSHNATVLEAHEIAIEEGNKMHAFYMNQIPNFVARMIHDSLLHYGLIKPIEPVDIAPSPAAEAIHAMPDAGTVTGPGLHHGGAPTEICTCPLPNEFLATHPRKCVNCGKYNKKDIAPAGPSDNIKVEEPAVAVSGDAESTPAPVAQS